MGSAMKLIGLETMSIVTSVMHGTYVERECRRGPVCLYCLNCCGEAWIQVRPDCGFPLHDALKAWPRLSYLHPRDPLHGITLDIRLVERHGWVELGRRLPVRCFLNNPSVKFSLTFL